MSMRRRRLQVDFGLKMMDFRLKTMNERTENDGFSTETPAAADFEEILRQRVASESASIFRDVDRDTSNLSVKYPWKS